MLLTLVGEYHDRYICKKKLERMWGGEREVKEEKGKMGGEENGRGNGEGSGRWGGSRKKGKGEGNFNV